MIAKTQKEIGNNPKLYRRQTVTVAASSKKRTVLSTHVATIGACFGKMLSSS